MSNLVIDADGLTKRYGDFLAVDDLDLKVYEGEVFGIIGPNGAGKTTSIEMITAFRKPDKGRVKVLGLDAQKDFYQLRERIGVQLQHSSLYEKLKVKEVLTLFASYYKRNRSIEELISMLQLEKYLNKSIKHLSGGWKQRVSFALALINDPDIVFLDEPTTGLDPEIRRDIWHIVQKIKAEGKTIILTTHYMEEAQFLCDRIGVFNKGKMVACGSKKELVKHLPGQEGNLEDVYMNLTGVMREEVRA
ncbi:ABC transporter ATP-binding protein [Halobacillus litoralis]|nr:ABC transporter ATP-binding protein [Halobacillus litoralis]